MGEGARRGAASVVVAAVAAGGGGGGGPWGGWTQGSQGVRVDERPLVRPPRTRRLQLLR